MPGKEVELTVGKVISDEASALKSLLDEVLDASLKLLDAQEERTAYQFNAIMLEGRKEAENVKRKTLGSAELQARNMRLQAFEQFFNSVVSDSLKSIESLPRDSRYIKALDRLIMESLSELDEGKYFIYCINKDREVVSEAIKDVKEELPNYELTLGKKPLEGAGGIVIKSKDGTIEYDNTFEQKMERIKARIRKKVHDHYFMESR